MLKKIILDFAKAVCEGEQTMIDEKKVELMKKLQRLAERGVGGEKEDCPFWENRYKEENA